MRQHLRNSLKAVLFIFLSMAASGCATVNSQERADVDEPEPEAADESHVYDPLEPLNRYFLEFNLQFDEYALRHVANLYEFVTPEFFRQGVFNFMNNLGEPFTAANQVLQGKPRSAVSDVGRFAVNSTIGVGGLFDPASRMELPRHDEDLGQTLAVWGVGPGPYLMLPFLGPRTVRSASSAPAESWTRNQLLEGVDAGSLVGPLRVLSIVNNRAREDRLERVREQATDPYIFIRNAYFERRQFLIYDGAPPSEPVDDSIIESP